jgi:putative polyhydroxyalkanoate system protein
MAKFRIQKPYTMPIEDVREATADLAANLEKEHGVSSRWQGDAVTIKGSGVDGKLSFENGVIDVSVKMGMVASMYAPVLKKEVQRFLDKHVT